MQGLWSPDYRVRIRVKVESFTKNAVELIRACMLTLAILMFMLQLIPKKTMIMSTRVEMAGKVVQYSQLNFLFPSSFVN